MQIATVQKGYVQALLKKVLFSRHLAALRELESLIQYAERQLDAAKVDKSMNVRFPESDMCMSAPRSHHIPLEMPTRSLVVCKPMHVHRH